jgi:ABC-type multidrug transport system ATPase subunit/pSer/pThr/pTyr-binding forkhead associated (FHA) protein
MKIFLAEDGHEQSAHGFDRPVITIGRDKKECQVIFDDAKWPMVSRKHAELRLENSRYVLIDLKSTQGTFVDGRRITQPTEVRAGARLQFGDKGPVVCVTRIEAQPAGSPPPQPKVNPPAPAPPAPVQPKPVPAPVPVQHPTPPVAPPPAKPKPPPPPVSNIASLELIDNKTGRLQRFRITKEVMCIGRDAGVEIQVDVDASMVSRRHAEIRHQKDQFLLVDLKSFNGTLHNTRRITAGTVLNDGDQIQIGVGGPVCVFRDPAHPSSRPPQLQPNVNSPGDPPTVLPTIVIAPGNSPRLQPSAGGNANLQLIQHYSFDHKAVLSVGREPSNDIPLDGLQISNYHARVSREGAKAYVEDVRSTNGVYVDGAQITRKTLVNKQNVILIGPFQLEVDAATGVSVYDTRAKTRIDVMAIVKSVPDRAGSGTIRLVDNVDLSIQPNEFVGLLGPSGAGKSTLMDALNGMRRATSGQVLINNLNLYDHIDALKQSIGYVPQEDIIHRELTVYRTLYYVARLRLSQDASEQDIDKIVSEVMDLTGLSERRDVPVGQLSGGQRKRVSIAVELITQPSVIFLDEPTSGLDPGTEEKIMKLFRQIAESGRTVILTTHAMENVKLFDKIVVLMRGKLIFYGPPREALSHVKASSFKDLYDKLEAPVYDRIKKLAPLPANATAAQQRDRKREKEKINEDVAEEWKLKFLQTDQYRRYIQQPLAKVPTQPKPVPPARRRAAVTDSVRQWKTLAQRYFEVLAGDKFNLLILFAQAPIIALLTFLVVGANDPRDFPYFVLALVAVWFGTSIAAREIIRERAVYTRERMVNLGILPYIGSKLVVLSLIVGLQCVLLFASLKLLQFAGLEMPGKHYGATQLAVMILTAMVGIALGLLISAFVRTSEMATSLVPLILIPQILFCGLVGVPKNISRVVGLAMPATWSFDEMKRLSSLNVLRGKDEQAEPSTAPEGRGLYKQIGHDNNGNITEAQDKIKNYKSEAQDSMDKFKREMEQYQTNLVKYQTHQITEEPKKPTQPPLGDPPEVKKAVEIPENLSGYVDFLHPWGGTWLDPAVLLLMFIGLVGAGILTLRSQDVG